MKRLVANNNIEGQKKLLAELENILESLDSLGMENAFDGTIESIPDDLYKQLGDAQVAVDNMVGILMKLTK
jgi:hypothetical protein